MHYSHSCAHAITDYTTALHALFTCTITHLHVHAITDINANTKMHIIQTCYMHYSQCTQTTCIHTDKSHTKSQVLVHIKTNMHYSQTCMNMQSDTSAHCTNTVCALYTMHAYANTNKSHPYALKITSALTQMHYTNMLHALFTMHIISDKSHTIDNAHICTQITPVCISSFVFVSF